MVQLYTGIDIIEIERITHSIKRWQERFLNRIYTENELHLYRYKTESLAARFAAKEAVMKALNAIESGITWRDIEILSDATGRPLVNLFANALDQKKRLNIDEIQISISHSRQNAVALVIAIRER